MKVQLLDFLRRYVIRLLFRINQIESFLFLRIAPLFINIVYLNK
jgi:hypothetical protein